jgi:acetoin utilization protein AcuB
MQIADTMTGAPVTIHPDASVQVAVATMDARGIRHLPVVDGDALVGVVSDRDLLSATGWLRAWPARAGVPSTFACAPSLTVRDVMTRDPVTTVPGASLTDALIEVLTRRIGCLPVVEHGRLVGILSETDLLREISAACQRSGPSGFGDPAVADFMNERPTTVSWFTRLDQAVALMRSTGYRHLPVVVEGTRLVGIVSDRDLRRAMGRGRHGDTPLEEIMTTDVVRLALDAPLSRAAALLATHAFGSLPVVDGDQLIGIVTIADVFECCLDREHTEALAEAPARDEPPA